jgi:hypothetical protein
MKTLSTHAAAAKQIRQQLKKAGVKAKVRASFDTVNVDLTDEMPATFAKIHAFCDQYEEGHFNGMEDIYEYSNRNPDLPQVRFVMVVNTFSDEMQQAAWEYTKERWADMEDAPEAAQDAWKFETTHGKSGSQLYMRELSDTTPGGFWSTRKPRQAA